MFFPELPNIPGRLLLISIKLHLHTSLHQAYIFQAPKVGGRSLQQNFLQLLSWFSLHSLFFTLLNFLRSSVSQRGVYSEISTVSIVFAHFVLSRRRANSFYSIICSEQNRFFCSAESAEYSVDRFLRRQNNLKFFEPFGEGLDSEKAGPWQRFVNKDSSES